MKTLLFFIMVLPATVFAQLTDGFADGDFTSNPQWTGDSLRFQVTADHRLQLHTLGADTACLATPSVWLPETEWRFWIRLGFNTSSNNNARVYLAAQNGSLELNPDGFYVQVGGGADSIDILKKSGQQLVHLFRFHCFSTAHSNNIMRFRIIRGIDGIWNTFIDTTGGENFIHEGSFVDQETMGACYMGVWCRYTSSNAARFYFDDFYAGPIIVDSFPPVIESAELRGNTEMLLLFSEVPEISSAANRLHYRMNGSGQLPDTVIQDMEQPEIIRLHFNPGLTEAVFDTLKVTGVKDLAGNPIRDTLIPVCYYRARSYDIVIDEVLADPEPVMELPAGEFIELYNRTSFPVSLGNWSLHYGSTVRVFPEVTIGPHDYLLVAKDSAYRKYGRCILLFTSSTSLSNEGTTLVLKDADLHVIHSVSYLPGWYQGTYKEEGGWSLEMIDTGNPCGCGENWTGSSNSSGGTPGRANSNTHPNPDETAPFPVRATIVDSAEVKVSFSESMDSLSLMNEISWRLGQNEATPRLVIPEGPYFRAVRLTFAEGFRRGEIYSMGIGSTPGDCAGNRTDTSRLIRFSLPDCAGKNDLVINEILANPRSGGSRFVELLNRSEKVLNLADLLLSSKDTAAGLLPDAMPLSAEGFLLFPGDYVVFSSDPADISSRFYTPWPERIERMAGFPVFDDDSGVVILARKDNFGLIDRVVYSSRMHYPLLASEEGVSLERVDPDQPSGVFTNWHSAASTVGFATPGYHNSQASDGNDPESFFQISPPVFSPDNDGFDDILTITMHPDMPDYNAGVDIYDVSGRRVRRLAANSHLPAEGVFTWDGTTDDHSIAPMGIYIVFAEFVNPGGTVKRFKRAVTVAGKF